MKLSIPEINHHIQQHILQVLTYQASAHFAEMRPPHTDSNLYSYHLKSLLKSGLVDKNGLEYTLSPRGLQYIDRLSIGKMRPRPQPKICTCILVKNSHGQILLTQKTKQPGLGLWNLPTGKTHLDETIAEAAERELVEKTGLKLPDLHHVGDTYCRLYMNDIVVSASLMHVFVGRCDDDLDLTREGLRWFDPRELAGPQMMPGLHDILHLVKPHRLFFAELSYQLPAQA